MYKKGGQLWRGGCDQMWGEFERRTKPKKQKKNIKIFAALYAEAPCLVGLNFVKKTTTNEGRRSLPAVSSDSICYYVVSLRRTLFC